MELAPGWTKIVGCPVGGRDVVLFYNFFTGKAETAYIDSTGVGIPLQKFATFAPRWDHIVFCNRYLFFLNESSGVAAIGSIDYDGNFQQNRSLSLGAGRTQIASDGYHMQLIRSTTLRGGTAGQLLQICTLTPYCGASQHGRKCEPYKPVIDLGLPQRPSDTEFRIVGEAAYRGEPNWSEVIVGDAGLLVSYTVAYRESAYIYTGWISADGRPHQIEQGSVSADWTSIALSNGYILFYDGAIGGARVVAASSGVDRPDSKWKKAEIQSNWTHIIPVGPWLLFYAEYSGKARLGYISPKGEFSGEMKL
jgi:hypothetical protein